MTLEQTNPTVRKLSFDEHFNPYSLDEIADINELSDAELRKLNQQLQEQKQNRLKSGKKPARPTAGILK